MSRGPYASHIRRSAKGERLWACRYADGTTDVLSAPDEIVARRAAKLWEKIHGRLVSVTAEDEG